VSDVTIVPDMMHHVPTKRPDLYVLWGRYSPYSKGKVHHGVPTPAYFDFGKQRAIPKIEHFPLT
jgi:hypothetical protein